MKPDDETKNKILSHVYNVHRKKKLSGVPDNLIDEEDDQMSDEYFSDDAEEAELIEMIEEIEEE